MLLVGLDGQSDSVATTQELFNADYTSREVREPWAAKNKRPTAKPSLAPSAWEVETPPPPPPPSLCSTVQKLSTPS